MCSCVYCHADCLTVVVFSQRVHVKLRIEQGTLVFSRTKAWLTDTLRDLLAQNKVTLDALVNESAKSYRYAAVSFSVALLSCI